MPMSRYPLSQLYFYLTEGCNLKCRHCWLAPAYQSGSKRYPMLPIELMKQILLQANPLGISGVKLTGGEPLMHPEIGSILSFLREQKLRLVMETNGVLLTPALAEAIALAPSPFVSVSLDGVSAETHDAIRGVAGSFEKTIQGITHLTSRAVPTQIIMSVMKMNVDQVEQMARLVETLGAESVKFNLIQPIKRGLTLHEKKESLTIEQMIDLGRFVEDILAPQTPLRLDYDHPMAFRPLSKLFGEEGEGCGACGIRSILGVLSDGSYALCGIGMNVPKLVFGHAANDRLADVWEKAALLNEVRAGLPEKLEGVCGKCLMKGLCLGGCLAQNYSANGHLFGPFWYCDLAYRKGLFPGTRLAF